MNRRANTILGLLLPALMAASPVFAAVEATEGWTRATPPGTKVAVGYFTLRNTGKGRRELLKITSPLAGMVSLHQTSVDARGVSRMWPVGKLALAPGQVLRFEPMGTHVMLEGLVEGLRAGARVPLTLVFQDEAPVTVQLDVRPLVDTAAGHDAGHGHEHR